MSNQAPKAIDWTSDEFVCSAALNKPFYEAVTGTIREGYWFDKDHQITRSEVYGQGAGSVAAWASARLHPEVARLDEAHKNVNEARIGAYLCYDGSAQVWWVSFWSVTGENVALGRGMTEAAAWFDAESRIASAPSPNVSFTDGTPCPPMDIQYEPSFQPRSVEACDQPVADEVAAQLSWKYEEQEKNFGVIIDSQHMQVIEGEPTALRYVMRLVEQASQSHPSLQESGDKEIRDNLNAIYDATIEHDSGIATLAERCLELLRSKSPGPPAGPLDVNRERVIEELLAKEGEFPTLFVNILRNWSAEKIGRLAEQLALRGEKPPAGPAFEEKECVGCRDLEANIRDWIEKLGGDTEVTHISLELERLIDNIAASAPIDLNATREEGEKDANPNAAWIDVRQRMPAERDPVLVRFWGYPHTQISWWFQWGSMSEPIWHNAPRDWGPVILWQPIPAYESVPAPPAFVQGIGGKP